MKAWLVALLLGLTLTQTGCAFLAGAAVGAAAEEEIDDDDDD
jgi:uncharacterized membrane protein